MSPADRATLPDMPVANVEDGVAPPWRCQACVQNDKYAVQRVVDVMRAENGQIYLLMEYLGYQYLEARPESWLEDKKGELKLAFKAHATVRPHKDMLYCGGALLEAMRSGQSLKALGLDTKLVPREKSLYLISHASLEKRGLSQGAANAYQMFHEPGNRLAFPFSLQNLQCTVDGRSVPLTASSFKRQHNSQPEPRLHAIANHLKELTENPASLPVALARALAGDGAWEGLGLLSGSTIIDIVNSLTAFCQRYGPEGWPALLRQELPDLTDADIEWLSDLSEEMEQFEPPTPIAVMDPVDADEQNLEGTARSTKKRCSARIANRDARAQPQETVARPEAALSTSPRPVRKRKSYTPSQPNCRFTRQYNTRPSARDEALANFEEQAEHTHSATEAVNDQRVSRLDPSARSELKRGLKPRGASHRPDPMSTSLYPTLTSPSSGAALVGAGDSEAPHTHPVTTQREREAMLHHADEQSPPPSPLAGSQRSCRPRLARARRRLIGASHRVGLLQYLQIFIHYLQCIGEQYSANGQRPVIFFHTDDMASTRDWKAMPPALDINQPAIFFSVEAENQRPNPVTDRSSGVGPIPGIEP